MPEVFTQNGYINAGRLQHKISHLRKLIESQRMSNERLSYRPEALNMVESIIDAQPKTDVKRVRHGLWIEAAKHRDENGTILTDYECSECFAMVKDSDAEEIESERFCYNCGARMDGGADNG